MTVPITPQIYITSRHRLHIGPHDPLHRRDAHRLPRCSHLDEPISAHSTAHINCT